MFSTGLIIALPYAAVALSSVGICVELWRIGTTA